MLKVMTFNLRVDTENDGINRFFLRTDRILKVICDESPDVIGFQEDLMSMRTFLRENLPEYTFHGSGNRPDYVSGGACTIAYKTDKFQLLDFESRWLSPTPTVPASTYGGDQSVVARIYRKARLHSLESGNVFNFINTHTDHAGRNARLLECTQLLEVVRGCGDEGFILCGDFNASPEKPEIQLLLSDESSGLVDVTKDIPNTFHGWSENHYGKIDYIFSNVPCSKSYAVEDIPVNGVFISDHNPVVACLEY